MNNHIILASLKKIKTQDLFQIMSYRKDSQECWFSQFVPNEDIGYVVHSIETYGINYIYDYYDIKNYYKKYNLTENYVWSDVLLSL